MVTSEKLYLVLLAAVGAQRLFETALSTRNARRAFAAGGHEVGQRHFRVMVTMHTLFLLSCVLELLWRRPAFPGVVGWLALGGLVVTQALRYWAVLSLGERWNVRVIVWPNRSPVTRGPYRFLRHPNYVAVILEMFLLPAVHGLWLTAVVFSIANALMLRVRVRTEESALGADYARSFAHTARFIPGGP